MNMEVHAAPFCALRNDLEVTVAATLAAAQRVT
jgi:hypothetical protein